MPETTYRPLEGATERKSIVALLREGKAILDRKEAAKQAAAKEAESIRTKAWLALRLAAQAEMGEVAADLPLAPPDSFRNENTHRLEFAPFGGAWILATFDRNSSGQPCWQIDANDRYKVMVEFRPDCHGGKWNVGAWMSETTDSLAEALALCLLAEEKFKECAEKCERNNLEDRATQSAELPPLQFSGAEERLIVAVRELLAD